MTAPQLTCPDCGWTVEKRGINGQSFLYLEEVTNIRPVLGLSPAGVLKITGHDHIATEDNGENPRLQCCNCLTEFPIPAELEIDFS
jgi:hypothetical protein